MIPTSYLTRSCEGRRVQHGGSECLDQMGGPDLELRIKPLARCALAALAVLMAIVLYGVAVGALLT